MTGSWAPHTDFDRVTRGIAAHGLAGTMLSLPAEPLSDEDFDARLHDVRRQRLTGLLWTAVRSGALPVTAKQAERAEWVHVECLAGVLTLEHLLIDAVSALDGAGIEARVLKGPVLAHLDYADPACRTFGDIDLLVRGDDFDRATALLAQRGHRRLYPEPRPGFDRRFNKGTSFTTADGLEIDLHRSFTLGPFGVRLAIDDLWRSSETFTIGGHELRALPVEERFVHACYHAVLGEPSPRLVPLRDVAQLALTRSLDVNRVLSLARASGGQAVVARAVRHAWHAFEIADVLALSAWAHTYRTDDRESADLAVYGRSSSYARKSVASIRALPRWRDRAAFVHALVRPTRDYLGTRQEGQVKRLRRGLEQSSGRRP